jgi:hypothetical protein
MKEINHLNPEEREHYILCDCGKFVDMRDLSDVINHLHLKSEIKADWSYTVKKGAPYAYSKGRKRTNLN